MAADQAKRMLVATIARSFGTKKFLSEMRSTFEPSLSKTATVTVTPGSHEIEISFMDEHSTVRYLVSVRRVRS